MNRRNFLHVTLTTFGALTILPSLVRAEERRRGGATPTSTALALVDPKDPRAKALNYVQKHEDLKDKTLQADRGGVKWKEQKCENCAFYTKDKQTTISGKKAAPCQLLTFGAVVSEGWCTSWAKKA